MKTNASLVSFGKIVNSGMGGFLNPPTRPEHSYSVRSLRGDTFCMSLTAAVSDKWLDEKTRKQAGELLSRWIAPDINSPKIQAWIRQVLGYFAGCYVGQDKVGNPSWNVSDLRISKETNPTLNADTHAGVHFIRKYYPNFIPTAEHFAQAKWGK